MAPVLGPDYVIQVKRFFPSQRLDERWSNPIRKACRSLRCHSRACSAHASASIAILPSLGMRCPGRSAQVVRLTSRKVDVSRSQRDNVVGTLTNSHARARMRRAQSPSFPRLLDASSRMRNAVGACMPTCFWLPSGSRQQSCRALLRAETKAQRSAQASQTQRRHTSARSRNERTRGVLFESKRTRVTTSSEAFAILLSRTRRCIWILVNAFLKSVVPGNPCEQQRTSRAWNSALFKI